MSPQRRGCTSPQSRKLTRAFVVGDLLRSSRWKKGGGKVPLALYALFAFAFLHLPLLILAVFSFNASRFTVWQGFSLHWYQEAFHDAELAESTWKA